jgi:hypothetical protein
LSSNHIRGNTTTLCSRHPETEAAIRRLGGRRAGRAPKRPSLAAATARFAGINASPGVLRVVGLADLALALGLYIGRPSWPWVVARAASNPAIAAVAMASARSRRARVLAAGLAVATASDLRTAARLRAAHR